MKLKGSHTIRIVVTLGLFLLVVTGVFLASRHASPVESPRAAHGAKETYTCPMHPSIVSDQPGKCPICHMDLQKVEDLGGRQSKQGERVGGRAAFDLSSERQQLIGVTTSKVQVLPLSLEVRASGRAAFDPELFTAIEEYRQAITSRSQMKTSPYESLRSQASELVTSARTRLKLLGLADDQIRKLSRGNTSAMSLLLPKENVWIYAEVFEYELPNLKEGQEAEVTTPSLPGRRFSGKVTSISPVLSTQTRTARVRLLVPDPDGALRPDTFVNVKVKVSLGEKLAVPADAVLHSGDQAFVFVVHGEGSFEPKEVTLGAKAGDHYEILSGLSSDEMVVTSANFLIDSESRLRGVLKSMKPHHPAGSPEPGGTR